MSVREVTELRRNGNLKEAYRMALDDLRMDPDNPWPQTSLFWVLRDLCQQAFNHHATNEAKDYLSEMERLLPTMMDDNNAGQYAYSNLKKLLDPYADSISKASELSKESPVSAYAQAKRYISAFKEIDPALHEDLGWIIYRYAKQQVEELSSVEIRTLLRDYIRLGNQRPSLLHTQMLNFALSFAKGHPDFSLYRFFLLWGPENLEYADFHPSHYKDNEIPSLVSRVCRQIIQSGEEIDVEELCRRIRRPKEETLDLLREPQFWEIMNLHKEGKEREMFDAFARYNQRNRHGASRWHSEVLRIADRYMEGPEAWRFIHFFKEWGYENLRDSDWEAEMDEKGNVYKPLAWRAAKKCYEYLKGTRPKDAGLVAWLSSFYEVLMRHIQGDEWATRQRAIIYTWERRYDLAIEIYKSLLLQMSEKYYIWSELADCVQDQTGLRIALLRKALMVERNEDFLGSIHLSLADALIREGLMPEALHELNLYKESHGEASGRYRELAARIGDTVKPSPGNRALYERYAAQAEEYAFSGIEPKEVTLVGRWEKEGKTRCTLTNGTDTTFHANESRFPCLARAEIGTVFRVRCHEVKEESPVSGAYPGNGVSAIRTRSIPLCLHESGSMPWSALPHKIGYVEYANEEKRILHIITPDSERHFYPLQEEWGRISKGDFVEFRQYTLAQKEEKTVIARVERIDREEALPHFHTGIVAVDDVNPQKKLFHFTFGEGKIGGIVFFSDTDLRPEVGQCLKVAYCVTKNREGVKKPILLHIKETNEVNRRAIKTIQGLLQLKYKDGDESGSPDFAFIDNYYVHRSLLARYRITTDRMVTADAVYAGQGKWKVIRISPDTSLSDSQDNSITH